MQGEGQRQRRPKGDACDVKHFSLIDGNAEKSDRSADRLQKGDELRCRKSAMCIAAICVTAMWCGGAASSWMREIKPRLPASVFQGDFLKVPCVVDT